MVLHDEWERDEIEAAYRRMPLTPPATIRNIIDPPTPKHIARQKVTMLRETLERKGA